MGDRHGQRGAHTPSAAKRGRSEGWWRGLAADKGCAGLCGAALSAPAEPGSLFEGKHHASTRRRGLPELFLGQSAEQACFKPLLGQWGQWGGHPGPGEGTLGSEAGAERGVCVQAAPHRCSAHIARAQEYIACIQGCITHIQGCITCSQGRFAHTQEGIAHTKGCIPHAQGCITRPTHPPPHQAGGFGAPLPAGPSALSPLTGSGAAPGLPAPTLQPLGKHRWGFPPVLSQPRCARSHAGAPCTPCPWAPANPNKHSRPPQRSHRGTGPPTATRGGGGSQTSPEPPLQPPAQGWAQPEGTPMHRGAQAWGGHGGRTCPCLPPPPPLPFPSCSETHPRGPHFGA